MGVGADGLIVAAVGSSIAMTLYNSDGTIAEMSGNGIRCLAAAVRRATGRSDREMRVDTLPASASSPWTCATIAESAALTWVW